MYYEYLLNKFCFNPEEIDVDKSIKCFGIINLTPDSFSDGSLQYSTDTYQLQKINEHESLRADVIDIGAESTKPNATEVGVQKEFERLLPFLENYEAKLPLSLDSHSPEIIKKVFSRQDLSKSIKYVNDVSGMQNLEFVKECAENCSQEIKFIVMHSKAGIPPPRARDVSDNFYESDNGLEKHMLKFFENSIKTCDEYGIEKERLILDPGFGFAKNFKQSFQIIEILPKLKVEFGLELFVGSSRKSFLRLWTDKIYELGFDSENLSNNELDRLTVEFNALLEGVDYFRMHA